MTKSILFGNGINIQFGGNDYLNSAIISRLEKNINTPGRYADVFSGTVDAADMAGVVSDLYDWSVNNIFKGLNALKLITNEDELRSVLRMSKEHSMQSDPSVLSVGMEDYLLLLKLFDAQYPEEQRVYYSGAEQAFCWLLLDALYNDGKLQNNYQNMGGVDKAVTEYDNLFTVNYDTNLDKVSGRQVYHLHGSFETLHHEYDESALKGWALKKVNGSLLTYIKGKEHLYCNAILGYSGDDKSNKIQQYNEVYEGNTTKILRDAHPELKMEPYPFKQFQSIYGELHIAGLNPNNDSHIFKMIAGNKGLSKVVYYYHDKRQVDAIKGILPAVEPREVQELWDKCN